MCEDSARHLGPSLAFSMAAIIHHQAVQSSMRRRDMGRWTQESDSLLTPHETLIESKPTAMQL